MNKPIGTILARTLKALFIAALKLLGLCVGLACKITGIMFSKLSELLIKLSAK